MTLILIALTLPLLAEGSSQAGYSPRRLPKTPRLRRSRILPPEVRTILSLKCAECHGARLTRPKGKFGNVEDLKRVTSDPNVVVPFRPDDSKLWQLLRDNEMPPKRAKAGSLTADQKSMIRAWIEAGAPSESGPPASVASKPAPDNGPVPTR